MAKQKGQQQSKSRKRRSNAYWAAQGARTTRNILRRLQRHCAKHPGDRVGAKALDRRR